jgi:branched-chain amino acid aminotransferase
MSVNISTSYPVKNNWLVYSDGEIVSLCDVHYLVNNQALNYGTGVFEGIRAYWDNDAKQLNLFRAREHYSRLIESAKVLKIDLGLSVDDLIEITINLIKKNEFKQDIYIRPLVLKKSLMPGVGFGVRLTGVDSTICINAIPMNQYASTVGVKCLISGWKRVSQYSIPSQAKITGSYVNSALAFEEAVEKGFDDAIMFNENNFCTEATTSNVFIVNNDQVYTPLVSDGILDGITRKSVIEMCEYLEITCTQKQITKKDLSLATEGFLSGTGVEILPVLAVDDIQYGLSSGPITHKLIELFNLIIRNKKSNFSHWLIPVY